MEFYPDQSVGIDLREELHAVIHGRADIVGQGRKMIMRRLTNTTCLACWEPASGGSRRPNCPYCKGEGYQFTETLETMAVFRGVTPVYKPGVLATGQYPQGEYGYSDANRGTAYMEVFRPDGSETYPNYERYTLMTNQAYDKLYELKVDSSGAAIRSSHGQYTRTLKWKVMSMIPLHGDNGRIEFFELALEKENV